jgi:two-component system phosphate regulon sensor histidine kinase PhoR
MPNHDLETLSVAQGLIAAFPLPLLIVGDEQLVVALNDSAKKMLGVPVLGRHFTTVLRHPKLVTAVEQGLIDRAPHSVSYQAVENDNDVIYNVHVQVIGESDLLLISFENVSGVAQAEDMRRDFIANVSHELRTPLTAVMGFIETLRGPARDDAKARDRFLGIMEDEAGRMNRLVGGLLSLSRVQADERVRPTAQIDLRTVVQTTLLNLEPLVLNHNVTILAELGNEALHVTGDTDQLMQVFTNLFENAVKYGGAAQSVSVTARKSAHDPVLRGAAIEIGIADQGPGIDPIHLPRLTERFYRADSHRSRELGGTGLGLAIVKHILNRHRGRLKITSQLGQGSQFTVILPLATFLV